MTVTLIFDVLVVGILVGIAKRNQKGPPGGSKHLRRQGVPPISSRVTLRNNSAGSRDHSAFQQAPNGDVPRQSFRTIEGALETGPIIAGGTKAGLVCTDDKGAKGSTS